VLCRSGEYNRNRQGSLGFINPFGFDFYPFSEGGQWHIVQFLDNHCSLYIIVHGKRETHNYMNKVHDHFQIELFIPR